MAPLNHTRTYLSAVGDVARRLDPDAVQALVAALAEVRERGGRVFVLGVGGSAANASHAVNDLRKLCGIEAYAPTDNVSELTARTNDEGWETTLVEWLRTSRLGERDALLVLSVGGGDAERNVSVNLVRAVDEARSRGAAILGVVGRESGHTARVADVAVVVPTVDASLVTPLAESFQSVVLHGVVSHPVLSVATAKWESLTADEAAADTAPPSVASLRVQIFGDGADLDQIRRLAADRVIRGFTTNPTLMRKAGVVDYERFARDAAEAVGDRPISVEVFSDDFDEMERQALAIAGWAPNIVVKIPVTDTRGRSARELVRRLCAQGVKVNVTALMTVEQVEATAEALEPTVDSYVSVFAGRIADTGRDPVPYMRASAAALAELPRARLIWASPRELLNVFQADEAGCHVITATSDILAKLGLVGKDLREFSVETVRMFHDDALAGGYSIAAAVAEPARA